MICQIAELGVDVPALGDLPGRCLPYLKDVPVDITIDGEKLSPKAWPTLSEEDNYYLSSGFAFYRQLLKYDGLLLHSSAVLVDGLVYLFSGPCGVGKSTHTGMIRKAFPEAIVINDDKPALRRIDGRWLAFGTPWCGKDGINENLSAPIAGICFLHRGDTLLKRLTPLEALPMFLKQSNGRANAEQARLLMKNLNSLVSEVPFFEFYNHAAPGDEQITYAAMRAAAPEKENKV